MIHSRSNTSVFHHANTPLFVTLVILILTAGCDRLPGKPNPEERWRPATEVTDFSQLYAQNCSGCHGADGKLGPAPPLNDALFLSIVPDAELLLVKKGGHFTAKKAPIILRALRRLQ